MRGSGIMARRMWIADLDACLLVLGMFGQVECGRGLILGWTVGNGISATAVGYRARD